MAPLFTKWFGIGLVALSVLVLQTTLAPKIEILGARPDWLIVMVVFFGLHAKPADSVIVGWLLGFFADLSTVEHMGLLSLSLGAAALFVAWIKDYVFRFQLITQFALTLLVCAIVHASWLMFRWSCYGINESVITVFGRDVLLTSLYSAVWAPLIHRGLLKFARSLGIPRPRYLYATTR